MARTINRHSIKLILGVGALAVLLGTGVSFATERYDGGTAAGCVDCHPSFQGRQELHDLHQGNGEFTNNCNLCHVSIGDNPLMMYSGGGAGADKGCMGCHGHDYGETILADYGLGLTGTAKHSGYGLRLQHFNKGVMTCSSAQCHDLPSTGPAPVPENVNPIYYARTDVDITDACNTDGSEDTLATEPNGDDTLGLDNDGDLLIDAADPDCAPPGTPGESGTGANPLLVTAKNTAAGTLDLSIGVACSATDQTLVFGPLASVSSYGYNGEDCSIDDSGTHSWAYGAGSSSLFFLVVPNDGAVEGSYGLDSSGSERPEDIGAVCPLPQDLVARCD